MHATRIAFTGLACLSVSLSANADQITLKNGDSLTGEVIAKRGNTLIFNTPYAGELKISWDEVATLKTTDAVAVMDNDERYEQRVLTAAATPTALQDAPAAVTPLAEILYINPGPEESGQGYRLTGKANFAYTQSDGNSNSDQLHADGEITLRARDYRLVVGGELDRASIEQRKADDTRRIYGSYDHFYTKQEFLYTHGQLQQDRFRDINLRTVAGGGYGYQLYDTETTQLSLKGGIDVVSVDRYIAGTERFAAFGWHIDFEHKLIDTGIEVFHMQDGYRGLSDKASTLLQTRIGLRFPLSRGFHALAQVNVDWESDPAPGRKKTDSKIIFGLGYAYD